MVRLREIVVCNGEELIYGWQTLEDTPQRVEEFRVRVQGWLDKNGFVLGEGIIDAALAKPYIGEDFRRMEYNLIAPVISGKGPYPFSNLISGWY